MIVSAMVNDWSRALEWDEAVYLAEALSSVPDVGFSAHRARGITLIVLPMEVLGLADMSALRLWMIALHSAALGIATACWSRLVGLAAVIGGVTFALMWPAIFYAAEVSPNLLTSLLLMTATAALLLADVEAKTRRWVILSVAMFASAALTRPTDSLFWALAIMIASVAAPVSLRPKRAAAILGAGLALGWLPWLVEAFVRFGDPVNRLRLAAQTVETGHGSNLIEHAYLLDGPLIGPDRIELVPIVGLGLILLLAAMAAIGLALGGPDGTVGYSIVLVSAALGQAIPYLVFTGALAPRFLLPAYGALTFASAIGLAALQRRSGAAAMYAMGVGILIAGGLVWHVGMAVDINRTQTIDRATARILGEELSRRAGDSDCFFASQYGYPQIQVYSGCNGSRMTPSDTALPQELTDAVEVGALAYVLFWSEPVLESPVHQWAGSVIDATENPVSLFTPN